MQTKTAKISSKTKRKFKGHVYNATTDTGNLFVEDVLVCNSGGLGTPAHLRVECVTADAFVFLEDGNIVEIASLLNSEFVHKKELKNNAIIYYTDGLKLFGESNFKLQGNEVYRIIERDFDSEIFVIKTRFGEELTLTENHPVAIMSSDGIIYKRADELSSDDFIVVPRKLNSFNSIPAVPNFEKARSHNSISLQLTQISEPFCYWLGSMLSDGDFTAFQFCSKDKYLCEEVVNAFASSTGFVSNVYHRKTGHFFASFNRKETLNLIKELGLYGSAAKHKSIPEIFMSMPNNLTANLLAGLFDGDGCVTAKGEVSYVTVSRKLAYQIRVLLLRFGVRTSISSRLQSWNASQPSKLYRVRRQGLDACSVFLKEIPIKRKSLLENANSYVNSTTEAKTMKRETVPTIFHNLEQLRQKLFLIEDEVLPKRCFKSYSVSDPSFKKINEMLFVFKERIKELEYFASLSQTGNWDDLKDIAKSLHLGYRKITKLSGINFRTAIVYNKTNKCLSFFQTFFFDLCNAALISAKKELDFLETVIKGDIGFDQIVSIDQKKFKGKVYDLTTDLGNFIANGVLIHNCGLIHKANKGVLFIDEISALTPKSQQELLTAMQEKKYSITGQSEMSSGSMVRTEAVPCDFVLVAAGNYQDLEKVHPALRSRIRGYGYEIYMNYDVPDTEENIHKLIQFVAQEIKKDGKIPHFSREAVDEILLDARRRANRKNRLTLLLRDLGGLVRAAGDIAIKKRHSVVQKEDLFEARVSAKTLEQQMVDKMIETKKEYNVYLSKGSAIGRVNGLAVSGDGSAGLILPLEAEITPAASQSEGKIIATGKLGEIAKEAVQNVSAIIKKLSGKDITKNDLHIQFLQTYEGVEGDSASVSVATAIISALESIPVKQDLAMTGSLSVRGEVLPVGGITSKIQAAIQAGFSEVIIPKSNMQDIVLPKKELDKIKIIPVTTLTDVLDNAFVKSTNKSKLIKSLNKIISIASINLPAVKSAA